MNKRTESILHKISRDRVKGFLRAEGKTIVNGDGEEILLIGWGLGNWLLPEGYMWKFYGDRYNRPRTIENLVRELCGSRYAKEFWQKFHENYITREDIRVMAEAGFNSLRLPVNWRMVMEDEPGIHFIEEGFSLIDKCLDWCEEFGLYVVLDLHGAPGGQTGHNIDDSIDDMARLFTDADSREKCLALWAEFARRYRDRWIVGAYDLLNEPVRSNKPNLPDISFCKPLLEEFYDECIRTVRAIDDRHMLQIEGYNWSSNPAMFTRRFDDNMCIHFHRYWCNPRLEVYRGFLNVSENLDQPLYLGETGENRSDWYASMYPLALDLNIGYNIWPWKKMDCTNSPYSIKKPAGWDGVIAYTRRGDRPSYEEAQRIFDEYLENIKIENCVHNPEVNASVLRTPGCTLRGHHFDELPGEGISFGGVSEVFYEGTDSETPGRRDAWADKFLRMPAGSFADYTFYAMADDSALVLSLSAPEGVTLRITRGERELFCGAVEGDSLTVSLGGAAPADTVRIACTEGTCDLYRIEYR